jgi:hypothetical protein
LKACAFKRYVCPLRDDTYLDMIYMPDAVKAAIDIMEADPHSTLHDAVVADTHPGAESDGPKPAL